MSLDTRIASAVEDLERWTFVDATAGLARLRETDRRRKTGRAVALAVVVALLAAGAVWRLGGPPPQAEPGSGCATRVQRRLVSLASTGGQVIVVGAVRCGTRPSRLPTYGHLKFSADGTELVHDTPSGDLVALDVETGDVRVLTVLPHAVPRRCLTRHDPHRRGIGGRVPDQCSRRRDDDPATRSPPGAAGLVARWHPDRLR